MFIGNDEQITVTKESLRKYGPTGAVILQALYTEYGNVIPIAYQEWQKKGNVLDFIDNSIVSSTLNALHKRGKIRIDYDTATLYLTEQEQTIFDILDVKEEPKPKKETKNEVWSMSLAICEALGQADGLKTPKHFLKFAKELLEAGYTAKDLEKYNKGDWWYTTQFKGQKGLPPKVEDIRTTISDKTITTTAGQYWL